MGRKRKEELVEINPLEMIEEVETVPVSMYNEDIDELANKITQMEKEKIDLIQQLQNKDCEINQLNQIIQEQGFNFNETVGNLIYNIFGPKQ